MTTDPQPFSDETLQAAFTLVQNPEDPDGQIEYQESSANLDLAASQLGLANAESLLGAIACAVKTFTGSDCRMVATGFRREDTGTQGYRITAKGKRATTRRAFRRR